MGGKCLPLMAICSPLATEHRPLVSFSSAMQRFRATSLMMTHPAIRTLIVDDEPIARQVLRDELRCLADVEIAGEAENGHEALDQITRLKPDLVLLDLQMPGLGGFDV